MWMKLAPVALLIVAVVAFAIWQLGGDDPESNGNLAVGGTPTVGLQSTPGAQQPGAGGSLLTPSAATATATRGTLPNNTATGSGSGTEQATETGTDEPGTDSPGAIGGVPEVTAVEGTTLNTIAADWGITSETLLWANPDITDPSAPIEPGTVVLVPPVDGVVHTVAQGETIQSIASIYGVDTINITSVIQNGVQTNSDLTEGMRITVAGASPTASRGGLEVYIVQAGDDLWAIAEKFGITAQTLAYANDIPDLSLIFIGQELVIPPADGVLYTTVEGDTVESIAAEFGVDPAVIREYPFNALPDNAQPVIGQPILIPGIEPLAYLSANHGTGGGEGTEDPFSENANLGGDGVATGTFMWPADGPMSQHFHEYHHGIDIANVAYSPVVASDGGEVIFAGWNEYGLGYAVAIDHGNGYVSWYGHFADIPSVEVGDDVSQGQWLGPMGTTGKSTGPHLHFVILQEGVYIDPLTVLP